ncbi:hypothetical protein E2C01_004752 [Portunus trituberculatus]|uniref:Uncharacterized protein n=1 Tax=Portunus trituberculatus TaxID=210409 RepID=A0A5B7CTU8_PORTR|nr:hypothetical protein [Portunus trituberculatus]
MEDCMKAGGSIKEKCSEIEKEVGPGCSKGHCCCALLDVCLGNPMCDDGRGLCRTACRDGEEVKYGLCGAHCKCCVAINEVPDRSFYNAKLHHHSTETTNPSGSQQVTQRRHRTPDV